MKKLSLLVLTLLSQNFIAQNLPPTEEITCGFDLLSAHEKQVNQNFENTFQRKLLTQNRNLQGNQVERIVPLAFHIFHTGEALGSGTNLSNTQIYEAIKHLNDRFSNADNDPNSTNTNIRFVLANRTSNGTCQEGIIRFDYSGNANYVANGTKMYTSQPGLDYSDLANQSRWDDNQVYNVYVVNKIQGATGYATFPAGGPHFYDRIVMNYSVLNSGVFVHEMGHAMNLFHSFEGSSGTDCPAQENGCGSGLGDCVADTPPHIRSHVPDNNITTPNACTQDNNSSFKVNAMTYNIANYMKCFTPQQALRMETAFDELRPYLARNTNPYFNMTSAPTADFLIDGIAQTQIYLCANNSVTLTNTSTCFLNTFQENSSFTGFSTRWEILKNGNVVQTSTKTNPTISFTEMGDYSIRLTVTNPAGTNTKTLNNVIKIVSLPNINYCTNVRSMNSGAWGTSISEFQLGNITSSTANAYNGYADLTCTKIALLPKTTNATINLKVTTSSYTTDTYNLKAFIDYNLNGLYDENELLGTATVPANNNLFATSINFNIPADVNLGQMYRLRIIGDVRPINTINCNIYNEVFYNTGDVEDYSVVFYDQNLSVQLPETDSKITLYPNPTNNIVTINSETQLINNLQVFDINGRLLFSKTNLQSNNQTVDLSNYNSGVYLIKVNNSLHKVIKN
nr:T9SS type A sorting domain-containing protein [uncultured Flavobacterium sp.]